MKVKRIVAGAVVALLLLAGVGCSSDSVAANEVLVWAITGSDNAAWLTEMEREFEAENSDIGIVVRATFADYNSILTSFARGNSPDIVYVDDEYFKRYADGGFITPLDGLIEEHWWDSDIVDVSEMWEPALSRYRFEVSNNTSDADDPLWCIPKDMDPTVLYYNEGAFEKLGITVISVEKEDLAAWNAGDIADANGKKKSDYAALDGVTVPARGYWRSDGNWVSGSAWTKPASGATLVFNNRIPMSWDEVEDLAMLCTSSYNSTSPTTYGYYTEWWFNYGWSVGGTSLLNNLENENKGLGNWVPPSYEEHLGSAVTDAQKTGNLYDLLIEMTEESIAQLESLGYTVKIRALYWMQGERDIPSPDEYAVAFRYLVSDLRSDLTPELAVYVGEISKTFGGTESAENLAFVAKQGALVAETQNCYLIENGDFKIGTEYGSPDTAHWSGEAHYAIGKLVGESILANTLSQNG